MMNQISQLNILDSSLIPRAKQPPLDFFEYLRKHDPVHWNPPRDDYQTSLIGASMGKGFWIISKYEDVQTISKNSELFSSQEGGPLLWDMDEERLAQQRAGIMGKDGAEHLKTKKLVMMPFTPKKMAEYEARIDQLVKNIIDDVAVRGECEFVFDIASRLPVATFCELMGVPEEDHEYIFTLGNRLADTESPASDSETATMEVFAYAEKLSAQKRESPDDSMMSLYANGEVDGERLSQFEVNMFFATLSIGGHETTRSTLAHFFKLMNEHPEQYDMLRNDPDRYLNNAISEVLRFSPPVIQFRRTCTQDTEIRGQQIKKGDKVYLSYPSANRDEDIFDDPNVFDITRSNANKHLSFGIGQHVCLGARLATTQLASIIREIMQRIPDITPSAETKHLQSIWFNAIIEMPVTFTPER